MEGYVDLSRLIDPIVDLEDLGKELKPSQLAVVFGSCMKNRDYVKRFLLELDTVDLDWIQDMLQEIIEESKDVL